MDSFKKQDDLFDDFTPEIRMSRSETEESKHHGKGKKASSSPYNLVNLSYNIRFKMPEIKHLSGITKLFTDFQKVTFESEKDLPVFLLN